MLTDKLLAARREIELAQVGIESGRTAIACGMLDNVKRRLVEIGETVAGLEAQAPARPIGVRRAPANDPAPVAGDGPDDRIAPVAPDIGFGWGEPEEAPITLREQAGAFVCLLVLAALIVGYLVGFAP